VRAPFGAAAGEHQADARTERRIWRNRVLARLTRLRRSGEGGQ
jgi:hypothetical protein